MVFHRLCQEVLFCHAAPRSVVDPNALSIKTFINWRENFQVQGQKGNSKFQFVSPGMVLCTRVVHILSVDLGNQRSELHGVVLNQRFGNLNR